MLGSKKKAFQQIEYFRACPSPLTARLAAQFKEQALLVPTLPDIRMRVFCNRGSFECKIPY